MFIVCNPTPETDDVKRDERIILVNPDHVIAVHKDYFWEGYHLISVSNGKSVASDLCRREAI